METAILIISEVYHDLSNKDDDDKSSPVDHLQLGDELDGVLGSPDLPGGLDVEGGRAETILHRKEGSSNDLSG